MRHIISTIAVLSLSISTCSALHLEMPIEKSGVEVSGIVFEIESRSLANGNIEFQVTMSVKPDSYSNSDYGFAFDPEITKLNSRNPEAEFKVTIETKPFTLISRFTISKKACKTHRWIYNSGKDSMGGFIYSINLSDFMPAKAS